MSLAAVCCVGERPVYGDQMMTANDPLRTSKSASMVGLMLARDDKEHPIPDQFRPRFRELVSALAVGDFRLSEHPLDGVEPINERLADFIAEQIAAYGAPLTPLRDEVWERSIYAWDSPYWQFLIDLTTTEEPVSDLVLHARLLDDQDSRIEVWSVHVP